MNTLEHGELVARQREAVLARSPQAFDAKVLRRLCLAVAAAPAPVGAELGQDGMQFLST